LCRAVCMQVAIELDGTSKELLPNDRLRPTAPR
jgi:hypothetical protein